MAISDEDVFYLGKDRADCVKLLNKCIDRVQELGQDDPLTQPTMKLLRLRIQAVNAVYHAVNSHRHSSSEDTLRGAHAFIVGVITVTNEILAGITQTEVLIEQLKQTAQKMSAELRDAVPSPSFGGWAKQTSTEKLPN